MDGPNHEANFAKNILNAQVNLVEIVRYLRFNKGEAMYQNFLRMYLPKLITLDDKTAFNEFLPDLENEELKAELKSMLKPKKEVVTETVALEVQVAPTEEKVTETVVTEIKAPKKRGPKAKVIPVV